VVNILILSGEQSIDDKGECRGGGEGAGAPIHRIIDSLGHLSMEGPETRTPLAGSSLEPRAARRGVLSNWRWQRHVLLRQFQ